MSSTKTLFQRRVKLCDLAQRILQHNTKKQTTPLGPGKMAVRDGLERLRHTSFKLNSPVMLKLPTQSTRKFFIGKLKVRRPGPNQWGADLLEGLRQFQNQSHRSQFFSPARYLCLSISIKISLSSSIPTIRGIPIHAIFLLPPQVLSKLSTNESKLASAQSASHS